MTHIVVKMRQEKVFHLRCRHNGQDHEIRRVWQMVTVIVEHRLRHQRRLGNKRPGRSFDTRCVGLVCKYRHTECETLRHVQRREDVQGIVNMRIFDVEGVLQGARYPCRLPGTEKCCQTRAHLQSPGSHDQSLPEVFHLLCLDKLSSTHCIAFEDHRAGDEEINLH